MARDVKPAGVELIIVCSRPGKSAFDCAKISWQDFGGEVERYLGNSDDERAEGLVGLLEVAHRAIRECLAARRSAIEEL